MKTQSIPSGANTNVNGVLTIPEAGNYLIIAIASSSDYNIAASANRFARLYFGGLGGVCQFTQWRSSCIVVPSIQYCNAGQAINCSLHHTAGKNLAFTFSMDAIRI